MKTCTKCKSSKSFGEFHKSSHNKSGLDPVCKACKKIARVAYWSEPANTAKARDQHLFKKFGVTRAVYDAMLEAQNGACAICLLPEVGKSLAVDHCHQSGKVRGLLCAKCNTAIGLLGDSLESLQRAVHYLEAE